MMGHPVAILGIGADGIGSLSARARAALAEATFVAGGTRHLALVRPRDVETIGGLRPRVAAEDGGVDQDGQVVRSRQVHERPTRIEQRADPPQGPPCIRQCFR